MRLPRDLPPSPGIYKIVHNPTGKSYVGQSNNVRARARNHKYLLTQNKHFNPPLQSAYNIHGKDSFEFVLLEVCSVDQLTVRKQYHIELFPPDSCFNTKPAGPSGSLGIKQPESQKLKHSRSKGGRPFYASNEKTGEVLRFEHVGDALKHLPHLQAGHIYTCLHGNRYSHGGFVFDYDPEVPAVGPKHNAGGPRGPNRTSRALVATDLETGKKYRYEYMRHAKEDGFEASAIYLCLAGKKPHYKGRTWAYADGQPHRAAAQTAHLKGARKHGGSRPIVGVHKITGARVHFDYIRQAAEALGIITQNISASIKANEQGRKWTAGGYLWSFDEEKEKSPSRGSSD